MDFYYDELNFKGIYDFIEDTKHKILFTHQPVNCKADWINIHGHLHRFDYGMVGRTWNDGNRYFNVSVEKIDYTPISFDEIKERIKYNSV